MISITYIDKDYNLNKSIFLNQRLAENFYKMYKKDWLEWFFFDEKKNNVFNLHIGPYLDKIWKKVVDREYIYDWKIRFTPVSR